MVISREKNPKVWEEVEKAGSQSVLLKQFKVWEGSFDVCGLVCEM